MVMNKTVLISIALLLGGSVQADEADRIMVQINENLSTLEYIKSSLDENDQIKASLSREFMLLQQENDELNLEIQSQQAEVRVFHDAVSSFEGTCHGTLPPDTYSWCQSKANELASWQERLNSWATKLEHRREDLDTRIANLQQRENNRHWAAQQFRQRADALGEETLALIAEHDRLKAQEVERRRQVLEAHPMESRRCAELEKDEDAHACLQRIWDGAQ